MTGLRGSAVLRRTAAGWRIVHYDLSLAIPNDHLSNVVHLMRVSPGVAPPEARAMIAALRQLHAALAARDTAAVRAALDTAARVVVVTERDSTSATVATFTPAAYAAQAVSRAPDARDSIAEVALLGDGAIATVWAPFTSRAGGVETGCGVEEVQLVKGEAWRITALAVRRRAHCDGGGAP